MTDAAPDALPEADAGDSKNASPSSPSANANASAAPPSATDPLAPAPRRRPFGALSSIGAVAQSVIPALYAWGVTVLPVAWARGSGVAPRVASVLAIAAMGVALVMERKQPKLSRPVLIWGFTLSCLLAWILAPAGLSAAKLDGARGFLGALGWLMFAFSAAAPPIRRADVPGSAGRIVPGPKLVPRGRIARGDGVILGFGFVCAILLQAIGWNVIVPERALLLRAVTLVSGIAIVGAATDIATARHQTRKPARSGVRFARLWPSAALLALLGISAVAYGLLRSP